MLTLRELSSDLGVRMVTGEARLDAPVRWVHISELEDPTPWLSGGELLLTTGIGLRADPAAYVARLDDHGLAGLGVGIGVGLDGLPDELTAEAQRRGFPLLEIPYELPFIAVTEKAFTHLVEEQHAMLREAISAHEQLEQVVLSERGLEGVVATLAKLVDGGAAVFDARGELLASRGLEGADAGGDADGLRLPVAREAGAPPEAWLVAGKRGGELTELDELVVHQAVTIVALELLRRRIAADTERRLAGDVLASLLSGELEGAELSRRLEPFGIADRVGAVVLSPPRELKEAVEDALHEALGAETGGGLAASSGALACALLPAGADDDELFELAERVRAHVSRAVGAELAAGAGRAVAAGDVRRAFHEARCALEARALGASGNGAGDARALLATYRDLGSFELLLSLQDDDALRLFCESILSPIEQGEGAYGGELTRSLEVFIECNGQWERAARQLYCHRHTLRYRIRRIEELTGRSLDSARDRIDFWLALRGRELL